MMAWVVSLVAVVASPFQIESKRPDRTAHRPEPHYDLYLGDDLLRVRDSLPSTPSQGLAHEIMFDR